MTDFKNKKFKSRPDTLLNTTFVASSIQGKNLFVELFENIIKKIKGLFHLRRNMKAASERVDQLEGRISQMEEWMDHDYQNPSAGHRIDKKR